MSHKVSHSGLDRPKSAGTSGQAKADLRSSMVQRFRAKPSKADAIRRTWFQTNPSASIENPRMLPDVSSQGSQCKTRLMVVRPPEVDKNCGNHVRR